MAFLDKWNLATPDRRYSDWTQQELDKLQAGVAAGLSDEQIAISLSRTMRGVRRQRAEILGIRKLHANSTFEWTPERVQQLKDLAAEGLSNGKIALRLGISRNAVIGKRDRLRLPRRERAINYEVKKWPRPLSSRSLTVKAQPAPKAKVIPLTVLEPLRVGFMELKRSHCRWVLEELGDDGLALYCGHPKLGPHSYCPGHWRQSIDRSPRRNRFVIKASVR